MIDAAIQEALLKEVEQLPPSLQRRVVDFAHSLARTRPRGNQGRQLLEVAGILSAEEAEAMMAAVEEGCERTEP